MAEMRRAGPGSGMVWVVPTRMPVSEEGGWVELNGGSHILAPDHAAPVLAGFRLNGYVIEAPS